MASSTTLLSLPSEVIEAIVRLSTFDDICNLRLAGKEAAAKSSQASFKAYFATKSVALSSSDLHSFVETTQPGWLGGALEHLTIVGTPSAADQEVSNPREEDIIALLTTAFGQMKANSRRGGLRSLSLTVSGTADMSRGRNGGYDYRWPNIWQCAGDTVRIAASAIKASGLQIENLDVYGSVRRCALSSGRLHMLSDSLSQNQLKSLSLTLSADEREFVASNKDNLGHTCKRILDHSHSLEHLQLRWFDNYVADLGDTESRDRQFFAELATASLPSLSNLVLRGIRTTSEKLLSFVTRHPQLRHLRLEDVTLNDGSKFDVLFAYIASDLELESLFLNDLRHPDLIQFTGATGESHFPHPGPPTWIERAGPETKRKIMYRPLTGRIKGSAGASNWHRRRTELYGPAY